MAEIVCPGKRLGRVSKFRAGPGTYEWGMYIFASVVGPKVEQAAEDGEKPFLVVSSLLRLQDARQQSVQTSAMCG